MISDIFFLCVHSACRVFSLSMLIVDIKVQEELGPSKSTLDGQKTIMITTMEEEGDTAMMTIVEKGDTAIMTMEEDIIRTRDNLAV